MTIKIKLQKILPNQILTKSLLILALLQAPLCFAEIYIYLGPNGERLVTDKILNKPGYTLFHKTKSFSNAGYVAANKKLPKFASSSYDKYIAKMAKVYKVDPALVKAVIHAESNFNTFAVSKKGAMGLMQLMPYTAQQYHTYNLFDPQNNIQAGVRHLKYLLKRYNNQTHLALAAYNAGETAVNKYNGIPPYKETKHYVKKVLKYKRLYAVNM